MFTPATPRQIKTLSGYGFRTPTNTIRYHLAPATESEIGDWTIEYVQVTEEIEATSRYSDHGPRVRYVRVEIEHAGHGFDTLREAIDEAILDDLRTSGSPIDVHLHIAEAAYLDDRPLAHA